MSQAKDGHIEMAGRLQHAAIAESRATYAHMTEDDPPRPDEGRVLIEMGCILRHRQLGYARA